ncbi:unnamed protein product, partial [Rotaria magnacalcarata]
MLLHYQRRLLLNLCRQTVSISNDIQSVYHSENSKTIQIRHVTSNTPIKKRILLKINTVLNEAEYLIGTQNNSDVTSIGCLNNELILSERMVKFPFHYRCLLEQQLAICQDRWVTNDEWQELYNIVGETTKPIFGSVTMLVCVQLKHIERGRSLYEFIQGRYPGLLTSTSTTYTAFMNLLALDFFTLSGKKHGQDYSLHEKEICDVYEKCVRDKKQSIVASTAALGIIKGLCVTRLWHEAYSYLPFTNDDDQLQAMTEVCLAALHNDDIDTAIKLVKNFKNPPPSDSAAATISSVLSDMIRDMFRNLNEKNEKSYEFIQHLFQYLSTLDYFIEKSAIDEIKTFFSKYTSNVFNHGITMVYPNGVCKQLPGFSLTSGDLTDDEFKYLLDYLKETAYTEKEVYNTATPIEFEKLQAVLARNKFTMIVDGLNILYGIDRFATDPVSSMVKTINFLKNLRVSRAQMLFIARKHALSRIPHDIQRDLRSTCEVFLVDNTSRDDWFVLYAALYSRAYVLTSDILRKERGISSKSTPAKDTQVNDKLQKWLYRYQYMFVRQANQTFFKPPMAYKLRAQYKDNVWLIPYFSEKPQSLGQRPDNWFFVYKTSDYKPTSPLTPKHQSAKESFSVKQEKQSLDIEGKKLMDNWWTSFCILVLYAILSHSQTNIPLTEPKLTSITAVNSTALTVTWVFANATYDQSDLIRITIKFYEFYYNYGPVNTSISYTFTATNKTITSFTRNFDLVNAFYYVCLSSNSTNVNASSPLVKTTCLLERTCSRANSSICSQIPFVIISNGASSSNSLNININWLKQLPYTQNGATVQLINNSATGTLSTSTENNTYAIQTYQFSSLQSNTSYTAYIIVNYTIFGGILTDAINYTISTSRASNIFST